MVCYYIYIISSAHRLVFKLKITITFKTKTNIYYIKGYVNLFDPKYFYCVI